MQINLNILTENNHSSLLSKNVPTADNALLQYMQKVTQGTNNADTEDKKQQKLQHIVNKLKHGKKLTAQEMEFLRMNYHRLPDTPEDVKKQRKHNGDNGFERKADDDSGSDNSGDLMSWTPLQDIIDAAPTLELKG